MSSTLPVRRSSPIGRSGTASCLLRSRCSCWTCWCVAYASSIASSCRGGAELLSRRRYGSSIARALAPHPFVAACLRARGAPNVITGDALHSTAVDDLVRLVARAAFFVVGADVDAGRRCHRARVPGGQHRWVLIVCGGTTRC